MSGLVGLHQPGSTLLHRTPIGLKLLALALVGVALAVLRDPVPGLTAALVTLVVAVGLLRHGGAPVLTALLSLRGLVLMLVLLGVFRGWRDGWPAGVQAVLDILALMLLATVVTVTTASDEMIDGLVRLLRPLRRVGVDADRVALAFSLMLRAIPTTLDLAAQTRDAARARGLERDPRARLVPLVLRVVANSRATGDALRARGVGDPEPGADVDPED